MAILEITHGLDFVSVWPVNPPSLLEAEYAIGERPPNYPVPAIYHAEISVDDWNEQPIVTIWDSRRVECALQWRDRGDCYTLWTHREFTVRPR